MNFGSTSGHIEVNPPSKRGALGSRSHTNAQVYRNTSYQKHVRDKNTFLMVYLVVHENIEFQHMDFKSKFPQAFIRRALRSPEILWGRLRRILRSSFPSCSFSNSDATLSL